MSIVEFLENKTILITGGSGFLAKILLEKILRIQPNVKKIYLLIRATNLDLAAHRFQNEVVANGLFRVLREKYGENFDSFTSEKVIPVAGDISDHNLGVNNTKLKELMWRDLNIIVNFAATTNFEERYDVALGINTFGALNVLHFAKQCHKLKMFLHVSTAYVCGEKTGRIQETFDEESKIDIEKERKLAEEMLSHLQTHESSGKAVTSGMKDFGIKRAREHGWPNTYVFTKVMGEMLLCKFKNDVPLIILRPTMVTSTYQQPVPGWIEGLRTIDATIAGFGKGKLKCLPYDPNSVFDAIPADMVINSLLVATYVHANRSCSKFVYHIGSSSKNPINFSSLQKFCLDYFTKNPLLDRNGKPIKVKKLIVFNTMTKFRKYMMTRYILPLKGLRLINIVTFQHYKKIYDDYNRKIKSVMRLANLYEPYMFFKGIFDDTNSEKLRETAREMGLMGKKINEDDDEFDFDPMSIDWENYFLSIHIPGLVNHVILKKP